MIKTKNRFFRVIWCTSLVSCITTILWRCQSLQQFLIRQQLVSVLLDIYEHDDIWKIKFLIWLIFDHLRKLFISDRFQNAKRGTHRDRSLIAVSISHSPMILEKWFFIAWNRLKDPIQKFALKFFLKTSSWHLDSIRESTLHTKYEMLSLLTVSVLFYISLGTNVLRVYSFSKYWVYLQSQTGF